MLHKAYKRSSVKCLSSPAFIHSLTQSVSWYSILYFLCLQIILFFHIIFVSCIFCVFFKCKYFYFVIISMSYACTLCFDYMIYLIHFWSRDVFYNNCKGFSIPFYWLRNEKPLLETFKVLYLISSNDASSRSSPSLSVTRFRY